MRIILNIRKDKAKAFIEFIKNLDFIQIEEDDYDPEFVAKIHESEEQITQGKTKRIKKEDLKEYLGL